MQKIEGIHVLSVSWLLIEGQARGLPRGHIPVFAEGVHVAQQSASLLLFKKRFSATAA